jgi:hypothetical protein
MEEKMLRSFAKSALAVAVLATGAFITPVSAEENAKIDKMSFSIRPVQNTINVTSSDGRRWDSILSEPFALWADIVVDTKHPGYVERAGIFLGLCSGNACGANPRLAAWQPVTRDWSFHNTVVFDPSQIREQILDRCNAELQQPFGTSQSHDPDLPLFASLSVNTREAAYLGGGVDVLPRIGALGEDAEFDGGDANTQTGFKLKVNCMRFVEIEAAPKPISVDIRVKQDGDTCPKDAEVTAYIDYDKPMTGRFRVIHNGKQGKIIEIKAREMSFAGKTFYRIERLERYKLDPGKHSFKIKVVGGGQSKRETVTVECPPFEATSMWLTLNTEDKDTCPKNVDATIRINGNRPGSVLTKIKNQAGVVMAIESIKVKREGDHYVGRLTQKFNMTVIDTMLIAEDANDSALNSGWQPLKIECLEALSGKLTLQSLGATSCKGEALVAIHTNGAGEMPYELECGPSKSWQRKVTAMANKIGVDKVRFDVTNNEQVTCALRTRIGGVLKSLDGASMTFQCHKPIDTGTSDLTPELPPGDPPVVGPTLTGDFSFIDNGGTRCPRQGKALINFKTSKPDNVHWSLDCTNGHFSGVAQTAPSPKGGYIAPALASFAVNQTTHAKCALKTVAPGKAKVHTLKGHVFQCVGRTDVGGPEDLTPETPSDPQKPGTAIVDPVKPDKPDELEGHTASVSAPKISCQNGAVIRGACVCEPTMKRIKAGKNAWRCVGDPKPEKPIVSEPKISCARGKVVNAACVCDRKDKLTKTGKNTWACVKVVVDPPRNKDKAKVEVKTAPKKTAAPKLGNADKGKGGKGKGKGKTAKQGNGSSALR